MSENPIGQMPIFSSTVRALNIVVKCNGRYGVQTFVTAFGALACALQRVELAIVSLLIQFEINLIGTMAFSIDVAKIWLTFCTFQRLNLNIDIYIFAPITSLWQASREVFITVRPRVFLNMRTVTLAALWC